MKKSLLLGAIFGILLTLAVAIYLRNRGGVMTGVGPAGTARSASSKPRDSINAPLVSIFNGFNKEFDGANDLMARREAKIRPYISTSDWDKNMRAHNLPINQWKTNDCSLAALSTSIDIRPSQIEPILNGQSNLLFVASDIPRCFSAQSKVFLVVDELSDAQSAYNIPATVVIERLVEVRVANLKHEVLWAMGIKREDLPFVTYGDVGIVNLHVPITIMLISVVPGKPILDGTVIPSFMAGVVPLKPAKIETYMRDSTLSAPEPPAFVDTRDPRNKSSGTYPGAIEAPFLYSSIDQIRFFIDMPLSTIAGARIDLSKLETAQLRRLILFGNDSTDASVVWVARHLRLNGYRRLYFVEGGFAALKKEAPQITF